MGTQHAEAPKTDRTTALKPNGYCHNCCLRVDDGILFCEPFCKRQWEIEHPEGSDN